MRSLRARKSVVFLGIAVIAFAVLVPAVSSSLGCAILTPLWLLFPGASVIVIRRQALRCDDQPVSFLSLVLSRAPPATLALA